MIEEQNIVIPLQDYLESIPNSALLFTLRDYSGTLIDTQVIQTQNIIIHNSGRLGAKFTVDQLLTTKMVPGIYNLFAYIVYPKSGITEPTSIEDYVLSKCITEKGIRIKVGGGMDKPSVGI